MLLISWFLILKILKFISLLIVLYKVLMAIFIYECNAFWIYLSLPLFFYIYLSFWYWLYTWIAKRSAEILAQNVCFASCTCFQVLFLISHFLVNLSLRQSLFKKSLILCDRNSYIAREVLDNFTEVSNTKNRVN